jgi:hypothetical protein
MARDRANDADTFHREKIVTDIDRIKYLRFALLLVGLIALFGFYPLTIVWPSGWAWHAGQSEYLQMILAIYATLGVFLLIASRDPLAHRSLIWFTVWSSVVHGAVMASPGRHAPAAHRPSVGRRSCTVRGRGRPGISDATSRYTGSSTCGLTHGRTVLPRRPLNSKVGNHCDPVAFCHDPAQTASVLVVAYFLASLAHFTHNAEYIAFYPGMPGWLTRETVYLAWLGVTSVGIVAFVLFRFGAHTAAIALLGVYGALGLDGLAHYTLALCSEHTILANVTIWDRGDYRAVSARDFIVGF